MRLARAAEVSYSYGAMNDMFGTAGSPAKLQVATLGVQPCISAGNTHTRFMLGFMSRNVAASVHFYKRGNAHAPHAGVCAEKLRSYCLSHRACHSLKIVDVPVDVSATDERGRFSSCR